MRIYLDVCCLNRPFDDHTQDKIRLESEAVVTILAHIAEKKWQMIGSEIMAFEISRTPDPDRRRKVMILTQLATESIKTNTQIRTRAKTIQEFGIKAIDALHIACAEQGKVEVFLTTDDLLLKICQQKQDGIQVKVTNPLTWLMEVM